MNSNSISSRIQTQFHPPTNPHKNSFPSSPSNHISFNFHNTHLKTPLITIRTNPNSLTTAASGGAHTSSPEETLYDLLGISESVQQSEIKRAYKQMALKYHPDVSPPGRVDGYTMRFIKVQEAYETSSDPESRAIYDSCIAKGLGFSGSRFQARSEEKGRWRQSWELQVAELKRRRTVAHGGRMTWAAQIRKQYSDVCTHGSDLDQ